MARTRTKYDTYQEASLSQKVAFRHPEFSEYAGTDPKTSLAIAKLNVLIKLKLIDPNDPMVKLVKATLNEKRKAYFATSERVNEITKLGFQLPKDTDEVDFDEG